MACSSVCTSRRDRIMSRSGQAYEPIFFDVQVEPDHTTTYRGELIRSEEGFR